MMRQEAARLRIERAGESGAFHTVGRPVITIVVPVYQVSSYLDRCVQSLVTQTYRELSIILVDDGSTDGSGELCDQWGDTDTRIQVIHQVNKGLSAARNRGLASCETDYVAFVDSDDYVEPTFIECLYRALAHGEADMSMCAFLEEDNEGHALSEGPIFPRSGVVTGTQLMIDAARPDHWGDIVAWNKLYRREKWDGIAYPEGRLHEDEFVFHAVASECKKVAVSDDILYHYVQRAGSIMKQKTLRSTADAAVALSERLDFYHSEHIDAAIAGTFDSLISQFIAICLLEKENKDLEQPQAEVIRMVSNQAKAVMARIGTCGMGWRQKLKRAFCLVFSPRRYARMVAALRYCKPCDGR